MDDPDHYSLQDLMDVKSGELTEFLGKVLESFEEHIRECVLCAAKGFFCELCDNRPDVIFPFDDAASRCRDCRGVFHRGCFLQYEAGGQCPRCERRRKEKKKAEEGQRTSGGFVSVGEDEEAVEATAYDEAALARRSSRLSSRE